MGVSDPSYSCKDFEAVATNPVKCSSDYPPANKPKPQTYMIYKTILASLMALVIATTSSFAQDSHKSGPFQGAKANTGYVTHTTENNGPLSNPPTNYIWMREAKLEFYKGGIVSVAITPSEVNVEVIRKDPAIDTIVPPNPKIFKLAEGFKFTEGPVWDRKGGYLLFSDPNSNTIYKYSPDGNGTLTVFREKSGYEGADIAEYGQPGSNGLTVDQQGRLTINQHGNRRVVRIESDGTLTVLADKFEGKRLNSPNDLVYRSDGTLYFTDPPFGLPKFFNDSRKELPFSGVFAAKDGKIHLISKDLTGPNGLAFSPDKKILLCR